MPTVDALAVPNIEHFNRQRTNDSESKHLETETSERLLIPCEAIAHVPNSGVSNSPLHTIHSHGDLSEAYSPINNSSQDASSRRR